MIPAYDRYQDSGTWAKKAGDGNFGGEDGVYVRGLFEMKRGDVYYGFVRSGRDVLYIQSPSSSRSVHVLITLSRAPTRLLGFSLEYRIT